MLLICSINTYKRMLARTRGGIDLLDLPAHIRQHHALRGMLLPTDILAGADMRRLDALRTAADKAQCPCLALLESTPVSLTGDTAEGRNRLQRVLLAAQRLGCSAVGFQVDATPSASSMDQVADTLKEVASQAERLEMNLLIQPNKGLTRDPENVTEIIKRVGGFRLGVMPDFADAAASNDPDAYIRRLAPYAPVVVASTTEFSENGEHTGFQLPTLCDALVAIGFDASLAVEYRGKGDIDLGLGQAVEAISSLMTEESK